MVQRVQIPQCDHNLPIFNGRPTCILCLGEAARRRSTTVRTREAPSVFEDELRQAERESTEERLKHVSFDGEDDDPRPDSIPSLIREVTREPGVREEGEPNQDERTARNRPVRPAPTAKTRVARAHQAPVAPPSPYIPQLVEVTTAPVAISRNGLKLPPPRSSSTKGICSICGGYKSVHVSRESKKLVCHSCYNRNKVSECAGCGDTRIIQAQGLCSMCYGRQRRTKKAVARPA